MKTLSLVIAGVATMFFAVARMASADPQPPELGVSSISLVSMPRAMPKKPGALIQLRKVDYLQIRLYCGGLWGGTYPAGRVVVVEMREAGKAFTTLHQRTLPVISSTTGYDFYVAVPDGHFTKTTTVRVRFTTPDAKTWNDSLERTFYHFSQNAVLRQRSDLQVNSKVKVQP